MEFSVSLWEGNFPVPPLGPPQEISWRDRCVVWILQIRSWGQTPLWWSCLPKIYHGGPILQNYIKYDTWFQTVGAIDEQKLIMISLSWVTTVGKWGCWWNQQKPSLRAGSHFLRSGTEQFCQFTFRWIYYCHLVNPLGGKLAKRTSVHSGGLVCQKSSMAALSFEII